MKTHSLKAPVSFLLLLVLAAFCFNNFAVFGASENSEAVAVDNLPAFEESTGTLTVKGHVLLNGQYVRTGVTVVNGSVIQTDTGAHALIEGWGEPCRYRFAFAIAAMFAFIQAATSLATCFAAPRHVPAPLSSLFF